MEELAEQELEVTEMEGLARTTLARVLETQLNLQEEVRTRATDEDWAYAMNLLKDELGIEH